MPGVWMGATVVSGLIFLVQLTWVDGLAWPGTSLALNFPWTGLFFFSASLLAWHVSVRHARGASALTGRLVFLVSLLCYLSTFRWHGSDDFPTSLLPFSILQRGSLTLDPYYGLFGPNLLANLVPARSHWVSFYPVTGAFLALPVYLVPVLRGVVPTDHVLHQLEKISASLICAAAAAVLFHVFVRRTSPRWAVALALVFALGTAMFSPASQALWQYGPSCLVIAAALLFLTRARDDERYWAACGLMSSLAVGSRSPSVIFAAGFLALSLWNGGPRGLAWFLAGAVPGALLVMAYWVGVVGTGLPAEFGFQRGLFFFPPRLEGFAGQLISPSRGILLYSPVVLFAAAGIARAWREGPAWDRRNAIVLAGTVAISLLLYACYQAWHGGLWSFGPRYLSESVTVLFFLLPNAVGWIEARPWRRRAWAAACAWSIACYATGAYATWDWEVLAQRTSPWFFATHPLIFQTLRLAGVR